VTAGPPFAVLAVRGHAAAAEPELAFALGFGAAVGIALWIAFVLRLRRAARSSGPGASRG
jgi:hypothetical protein